MSFWKAEYNPNADQYPQQNADSDSSPENTPAPAPSLTPSLTYGKTHPDHPGIIPVSPTKYRAYKNIHGKRTYLGTFPTLGQALASQSSLNEIHNPERPSHRNTSLLDLTEHHLTQHGDYEP